MSAINKPLHAWEGGGWSPPLPPKSLWCGHSNMTNLCVEDDLVDAQVIEIVWDVISWIVRIWRATWKEPVPVSPASSPWDDGGSSILVLPYVNTEDLFLVNLIVMPNSLDNLSNTVGAKALILQEIKSNNVLSTNLNDLHLVRPVNVPPTGLSFQNTDAAIPEKG